MRKLFLATIFSCTAIFSYSQTTQSVEQLKSEINKLKEENASLRNSLKIGEPIQEVSSDGINFKLISIVGDKKAQAITCTLTLTTTKANWLVLSRVKSIIDIDGNEYTVKSSKFGAENGNEFGKIMLNTDVPIKCTYTFGGVLPSVKIIKLFKFQYMYENNYKDNPYVEFRDLTINWN